MITIDDLNNKINTEQKGKSPIICRRCSGDNISINEEDVSPDYIAACLDCDEDMYLFELCYLDGSNTHQPLIPTE